MRVQPSAATAVGELRDAGKAMRHPGADEPSAKSAPASSTKIASPVPAVAPPPALPTSTESVRRLQWSEPGVGPVSPRSS
jgi:hypothetical protein